MTLLEHLKSDVFPMLAPNLLNQMQSKMYPAAHLEICFYNIPKISF